MDHTLTPATNWTQIMKGCKEAKPLMTKLVQIYHSNFAYDPQTHPHYPYVCPPLMDI